MLLICLYPSFLIHKNFKNKVTSSKAKVFFIGKNKEMDVDLSKIKFLDVTKTGDRFPKKICNVCHRYLDTEQVAKMNELYAKNGQPSINVEGLIPLTAEVALKLAEDIKSEKARCSKIDDDDVPPEICGV